MRYHNVLLFLWLQIRQMKAEDRRDKIAVIVGTVTNDIRILTLPKLKVGKRVYTLINRNQWQQLDFASHS